MHTTNALPTRIIARLDVKKPNVVKGIQLEGLRIVGAPEKLAISYQRQGIDELIFIDCVASLYRRNTVFDVIETVAENMRIPFTVGGGVKGIYDFDELLAKGADKVLINTWATKTPSIVSDAAKRFGSQCVVASIEAKTVGAGKWEVYIDNGRENTNRNVTEWVKQLEDLGAGELFLTSIDKDGSRNGFDIELCQAVCDQIRIPVIISGGAGSERDVRTIVQKAHPSAVALGTILHFGDSTIARIKEELQSHGHLIRPI